MQEGAHATQMHFVLHARLYDVRAPVRIHMHLYKLLLCGCIDARDYHSNVHILPTSVHKHKNVAFACVYTLAQCIVGVVVYVCACMSMFMFECLLLSTCAYMRTCEHVYA